MARCPTRPFLTSLSGIIYLATICASQPTVPDDPTSSTALSSASPLNNADARVTAASPQSHVTLQNSTGDGVRVEVRNSRTVSGGAEDVVDVPASPKNIRNAEPYNSYIEGIVGSSSSSVILPEAGEHRISDISEDSERRRVEAGSAGVGAPGQTTAERRATCNEDTWHGGGTCNTTWDGVMCWPATAAGTRHQMPCFFEFNDIFYNTSNSASRLCAADGVWAPKADYSRCQPLSEPCPRHSDDTPAAVTSELPAIIYFVGYSASLVALAVATAIFRLFNELHCPRNTIHASLFVTCMVTNLLWIIALTLALSQSGTQSVSCLLVVLLHYFHVATFFWMFVEGLYLYRLVVQTFGVEQISCYSYPLIGWGVPSLIVTGWGLVKWLTAAKDTKAPQDPYMSCYGVDPSWERWMDPKQDGLMFSQCPWLQPSDWDWLFIGPALLVLACNVIFLARVMWVLITKLRSTNSAETQQYKKATKALLVLLPLLGLTYILVLASPSGGLVARVFAYVQAVLISTQGLTVAMIYCFCNAEVQATLRNRYLRHRAEACLKKHPARRRRSPGIVRYSKPADGSTPTELTFVTVEPETA